MKKELMKFCKILIFADNFTKVDALPFNSTLEYQPELQEDDSFRIVTFFY